MTKLNQIIAVEKGAKSHAVAALTAAYHRLQAKDPFQGISRVYEPLNDEGERYPDEVKRVEFRAAEIVDEVVERLTEYLDVVLTKDVGNCSANADVKIGDTVVMTAVPVTHLLTLEKQLVDIRTFFSKLPVLDPAEEWTMGTDGNWVSSPSRTAKSKKVPHNHVKWEPPNPAFRQEAQVDIVMIDDVVGHWTNKKFSGALPGERIAAIVKRVEALQAAVKQAREEANGVDVRQQKQAGKMFAYILGD